MKQKHLWVALVAIIILAGGWWYLDTRNKASAPENTSENTAEEPATIGNNPETPPQEGQATNVFEGNNALIISDQIAGSTAVNIDNVNLDEPGFVVISSADNSGQILGSTKLLSSGKKQDLEIPTRSTLLTNVKYQANIYIDDGDKLFNSSKDTKLTGTKSQITFFAK